MNSNTDDTVGGLDVDGWMRRPSHHARPNPTPPNSHLLRSVCVVEHNSNTPRNGRFLVSSLPITITLDAVHAGQSLMVPRQLLELEHLGGVLPVLLPGGAEQPIETEVVCV